MPPVILPSLDRLSTLIERVVELIDAVGATQAPASDSEPDRAPERPSESSAVVADETGPEAWLAFVPSPHGYRLVEREGSPPARGEALVLEDGRYLVLRLAPSPLPGDGRACAYLEREEPTAEDRSFDR